MNSLRAIVPEERADRIAILIAWVIATLIGYFLFFYPRNAADRGQGVPIGLLHSDKNVRIRHAKSLRWATSRDETEVFLRDTIYTPKGTSAEFRWQDKYFVLEPDSLVQFDEASLDKLEITLLEGKIKADPSTAKFLSISKTVEPKLLLFKHQDIAYLPDINPLIIRHSELSARAVDSLAKRIELEPLRSVVLPKLFLNQLSDYQFVIQSPHFSNYKFLGQSWLEFKWMPIPLPNIEYIIQISDKGRFKDSAQTQTKNSQALVLFEQAGSYGWRVIAQWRRENLESESKEIELDPEKGEAIPARAISSEKKRGSETSSSKAPSKVLKPEKNSKPAATVPEVPAKPKTPFEILFGN